MKFLLLFLLTNIAYGQFTNSQKPYLDKNNGILNAGFEEGKTKWTIASGTASTTSSTPFGDKALTITASSQASTLTSSSLGSSYAGLNCMASAYVQTSSTLAQVCPVIDGTVSTSLCVNVNSNNALANYQIPVVCGATSTAVQIRFSSSTTGSFNVDNAFVGVSPVGNISSCSSSTNCATVFSVKTTQAGTVSQENLDWINGSCSSVTTGRTSCTVNSNIFTVAPNCTCTASITGQVSECQLYPDPTTSTIITQTYDHTGTGTNVDRFITCQKQGVDYTNAVATSPSINASNADFDYIAYTPSFTGFGTATSIDFKYKRVGSDAYINGIFTCGTTTGVEAQITLPSGLTSSTANIQTLAIAGSAGRTGTISTTTFGNLNTLMEPTKTYFTMGDSASTRSSVTKQNGTTVCSSGDTVRLYARIPIQGWQNSNVIIGSFANILIHPNVSTPKGGSAHVAGATIGTVCSGTCSLYNNYESMISSITRNSSGDYTINFTTGFFSVAPRCVVTGGSAGSGQITYQNIGFLTSTATKINTLSDAGSATDGYFTIQCDGY
jgi:hypothetical protein